MSSQWTSKYAIMRDLSLAQGCDVPAALDSTVGMDEKPPALNIPEETEEDYFGHYIGDGDTTAAPDLSLIQQMLQMVRGSDCSADHEEDPDMILQITKPPCINGMKNIPSDTVPKTMNNNNTNVNQNVKTKKKRVNVAVNSILEAIACDTPITNMECPKSEPVKLLKPTDFMSNDKEIMNSMEKVNGWLDAQQKDLKPSTRLLNWDPSSMFKRKSGSYGKSGGSDSLKSSPPQKVSSTATASYQASTMADEYYQKYVERIKLKEYVKEDVWTRAEKIMKEIDAKRQAGIDAIAEKEAIAEIAAREVSSNVVDSSEESTTMISPEAIQLPQHRHLLTGECVVCDVVKGRGFDPDSDAK